ncbi:MAG: hypothetical protein WA874_19365 [Chryseosolibacter sp.]
MKTTLDEPAFFDDRRRIIVQDGFPLKENGRKKKNPHKAGF